MKSLKGNPHRGSLVLVVLCLLAVLGIALASYLAVSNQSMKLSNRIYAKDVSRQLAEMGLERALRSYNGSTFSSWTHPDATTSTRTINITSSHYGNTGITTAINVRVDHYLDPTAGIYRGAVWSGNTTYAANDFVWYHGVWYLCTTAPTSNQAPSNTTYWKAAPGPWSASATYQVGNIALSGGNAYRCTAANINTAPPNASYWASYTAPAWNSATTYAIDDVVMSGGVPYRCLASSLNHVPPNSAEWLSGPVLYSEGVATLPDSSGTTIKTQLRALIAPAPLFPNAAAATTLTTLASGGTVDSYNSLLSTYALAPASSNYSAIVAGGNTAGTAVTVTTATVKGYVAAPSSSTTPYAPLWNYGAATLTGSAATGIDLTRVSRSPYVPQLDIQTISTGTNLPVAASQGGVANTTLIDGAVILGSAGGPVVTYNIIQTHDNVGNTNYPGLDLYNSGQNLTINGPVILNVTGLFRIYKGMITIASTGSLEIYFTGLLDIGYSTTDPAAGIFNNTNDPKKCLIVSANATNTVNNHYIRTVNPMTATVYMPNAYLTITSNNKAIYGALSAKNIRFSSNAALHYDTALRNAGKIGTFIDTAYMITELRELTDPTEKVVLP